MKERNRRNRKGTDSGLADSVTHGRKPDDVLQGPGFRMERHGRYIKIDTHRTKEEHRRLTGAMAKSREALVREIRQADDELLALVHRYNSLELLAHISLLNLFEDMDTYKEYATHIRPPYIEHLALLELSDAKYEVRSLEMPDGPVVERAQSVLDTIFHKTVLLRMAKSVDSDRDGPPTKLEELAFRQYVQELVVRSPTYYDHWCDVLPGLFGSGHVAGWMTNNLGFDMPSALKMVEAVPHLMQGRLASRLQKAKGQEAQLVKAVYEYKRTGKYEGPEQVRKPATLIRNLGNKEAKRVIRDVVTAWGFFDLACTFSFTCQEIAEQAAVSAETAKAFLEVFSIGFGSTDKDYVIPELTHQLKLRPVIRHGENFFCPVPHLLLWAVKPAIESALKLGGGPDAGTSAACWERYQTQRAGFLVRRGLDYFRRLLPRATIFENLKYSIAEQDGEQAGQLDALVLFDRYAFFVEAKGGEFSVAARRGAPARLLRDLKDLVAEPHSQAKRALQFVSSTDNPVFWLSARKEVRFDKAKHDQSIIVAITLDHFDALTAALFELREIGILAAGELPWSVNMSDLRIIAESLSIPVQFTHYLKWRLHLNHAGEIHGHDELNWLGVYIAEGPRLLTVPEGNDRLDFTSYLTEFDDYYLYEMGERTKPAKRPEQYIPAEMRSLLNALETVGGYGYSSVGEALLDLDFKQRDRLANVIAKSLFNALKDNHIAETISFGKLIIELRPFVCGFKECERRALDLCAAKDCDALVLSLGSKEPLQLAAWGLSRKDTV